MDVKIKSLWPLIAFILLILLLNLTLFLIEGDTFVASKFIQQFWLIIIYLIEKV